MLTLLSIIFFHPMGLSKWIMLLATPSPDLNPLDFIFWSHLRSITHDIQQIINGCSPVGEISGIFENVQECCGEGSSCVLQNFLAGCVSIGEDLTSSNYRLFSWSCPKLTDETWENVRANQKEQFSKFL